MKHPDIIIAEFEARRSAERQTYRSGVFNRAFELFTWWTGCVFAFVWLVKAGESAAALLPILLAGFITESVRKRWKLEERIAELERRAQPAPGPSAPHTSAG